MNESKETLDKLRDERTARTIHDLERQIEYWRGFAAYLASCHAATVEYDGQLKGTSKSRRSRFGQICFTAVMGLSGRWFPKHDSDRNVEAALDRCRRAAELMR